MKGEIVWCDDRNPTLEAIIQPDEGTGYVRLGWNELRAAGIEKLTAGQLVEFELAPPMGPQAASVKLLGGTRLELFLKDTNQSRLTDRISGAVDETAFPQRPPAATASEKTERSASEMTTAEIDEAAQRKALGLDW